MRRLGLIGSLTADMVDVYWHTLNREVLKFTGGRHPANVIINCVKAPQLEAQLHDQNWSGLAESLMEEAQGAARAGAEGLVICASALNPIVPEVVRVLDLPIVVPGQAVTAKLRNFSFRRVAVLGIRTSREERMWRSDLGGLAMIQPSASDNAWLNQCVDNFNWGHSLGVDWTIKSNQIVSILRREGAQALVFADPTFAHWIKPDDSLLQPFNAAVIHAWTAAIWALESDRLPAPPCILAG